MKRGTWEAVRVSRGWTNMIRSDDELHTGDMVLVSYPGVPDEIVRVRVVDGVPLKDQDQNLGSCRDCGAYGPRDGAGNGWNCGCASE